MLLKQLLCLVYFICAACTVQGEEPSKKFVEGNQKYSSKLFKELSKNFSELENVIFSPYSIENVLALIADGAWNKTRSEIIEALGLPENPVDIHDAFGAFSPKININDENTTLTCANKLYASSGANFFKEFAQLAVNVYNAEVENVNYNNPEQTAAEINDWVSDKTRGKIPEIIAADQIPNESTFIIVNAIYMNSKWKITFQEKDTKKEKFYKFNNEIVDVEMMTVTENFNYRYAEEMGVQYLQLPYSNDGLSMVFALPIDKNKFNEVQSNIDNIIEDYYKNSGYSDLVEVHLPKYTIQYEISDLTGPLGNLGIKTVFTYSSELYGIIETDKPYYVNSFLQKAFIDVSESGTEAAAASSANNGPIPAPGPPEPEPKIFYANHPFFYWIEKDGVILFAGRVVDKAEINE